jgi:hypothetical protein
MELHFPTALYAYVLGYIIAAACTTVILIDEPELAYILRHKLADSYNLRLRAHNSL